MKLVPYGVFAVFAALTHSDHGSVRTVSGVTSVTGKKSDALNNVWRRVSK